MNDEPTSNSETSVNLAGKNGYQTVIFGDDEPQMDFIGSTETIDIVIVVCMAIVACVAIVSVAVYETKKLSVPQVSGSK